MSGERVRVDLSLAAARFLVGCVEYLNTVKAMPEGGREALETSAWLEEIEARTRSALEAQVVGEHLGPHVAAVSHAPCKPKEAEDSGGGSR